MFIRIIVFIIICWPTLRHAVKWLFLDSMDGCSIFTHPNDELNNFQNHLHSWLIDWFQYYLNRQCLKVEHWCFFLKIRISIKTSSRKVIFIYCGTFIQVTNKCIISAINIMRILVSIAVCSILLVVKSEYAILQLSIIRLKTRIFTRYTIYSRGNLCKYKVYTFTFKVFKWHNYYIL